MVHRRWRALLPGVGLGLLVALTIVLAVLAVRGSDVDAGPVARSVVPDAAPPTPSATPTPALPALLRSTDGPLTALWLGDAITAGAGASSPDRGYRVLVRDRLLGDGPVQEQTVSDPGGTVAGVGALPSGLGLAVVELGTAEVATTVLPDFAATYGQLLARLRSTSPDAVLVCTGVWLPQGVAEPYDTAIGTACAAAGGTFVPLSDVHDRPDTLAGQEPDDTGHQAIAARVLDALGV